MKLSGFTFCLFFLMGSVSFAHVDKSEIMATAKRTGVSCRTTPAKNNEIKVYVGPLKATGRFDVAYTNWDKYTQPLIYKKACRMENSQLNCQMGSSSAIKIPTEKFDNKEDLQKGFVTREATLFAGHNAKPVPLECTVSAEF